MSTSLIPCCTSHRTEGADINDDVIYSLQSVEVFKAENINEPEYAEGSTFDAAMPGNDGLCGMNLNIGVDYLIDFNREGGEINAVGLCGLSREWSFVDAEDEAILREGCDDYDPCEGSCDEFQVEYVCLNCFALKSTIDIAYLDILRGTHCLLFNWRAMCSHPVLFGGDEDNQLCVREAEAAYRIPPFIRIPRHRITC